MSSAGNILDTVKRMKANRSLRTKRSEFDVKAVNRLKPVSRSAFTKYTFKKASPEFRKRLQTQMAKSRKCETIKRLAILGFSILITLLIFL